MPAERGRTRATPRKPVPCGILNPSVSDGSLEDGGVARLTEHFRRLFAAQAERRYTRQAAMQLLELYRQQHREHPDVSPRALYESVVAQRLGPDATRAAEVVRRAEESFTDWPVERELGFRHVVHYLIFEEYMRWGRARAGTKTNMGVVVAHIVPEEI